MSIGQPRREAAPDRLAGHAGVEPLSLQGPGLSTPPAIRAPDLSSVQRIAAGLSDWAGGKLEAAVNKQHEKDMLAGQMAYTQGKTLEEVNMAGNKWALEGYRLIDAQTTSSSLLAAQREEINQGDYELTPEAYRNKYVQRLDMALEGVDPETAKLVREQMAAQMPTLVADHTTANLQYTEQQAFDALERSIDIVSRDPTATEALIVFAQGGEDSPSAGLSDDRRKAAVVSGVVRAFDNDNPLAWSALQSAGVLDASDMTSEEKNAIESARQRFETRRRTEYNEELFTGEQDLMTRVENGELSPGDAVDELAILYADHGIKMDRADAGAIYSGAEAGQNTARQTRGLLIEEAGLRGDRAAQANIIMDSLIGTESSGNADARRTNADGRSFGGLVQMGQARLDEVTAMMGLPHLTVAEYTAMSAQDQKKIAQRHFIDLIEAAEATGAIGTTINGVTVTLSGLVAVGHLGGKGGMRQFVESGGAYNPTDELGTSLTDYLSKHGSGEMQEYMGAEEKYNRAKATRDATRERLALDAYAATEPDLNNLDQQFIRGEIERNQWKAERDALYGQYGRAVTKADVDHEVATIKAADDFTRSAAEKSGDENYRLGVEAANAALSVKRLAWEDVLNNPASTSEEIQAANAQYIADRQATFDSYGVKLIDRNDGAETTKIVTRTRAAMEKHKAWSEEEAEIGAAIAGGYVADLPKNLQERAFKKVQDDTIKTYTEAVVQGSMSEEAANTAIARDMNVGFAKMGVVDPKVARRMTAAVMGTLVDKEGNPNPMVVDAIAQWAELKALNPRAADTMLSGEALARAEAVLAKTGGDPGMLAEAVRDLGVDISRSPLATSTEEFMARPDVQSGIDDAVDNLLASQDIGIFQAIFSDRADVSQTYDRGYAAQDRMYTEENRAAVRGEIAEELARLQRQNPNIKASDLSARAAENVARRTQFIGGDVVVLPVGQDFGKMFFGSRAGEFDHDGAVNSAVMEWLRSPEAQQQYGFLSERTFAEGLPGWLQGTIDAIPGVTFQPAMSWTEAGDTDDTGVRPFRAFVTANKTIAVEVLLPNGNFSEPIIIPADRAGKAYMDKKRGEMIADKPRLGVVPGLGGMGGITMP